MTVLAPLFVGLTALIGATVFALLPLGTTMRRALASAVFCLSVAALFVGTSELLSRPKPMRAEWLRYGTKEAEILKAYPVEKKAIYLWLLLPDAAEPRSYVMPWDEEKARQLHELMERHGRAMMALPFQPSWERRRKPFHPAPQPKYPDKWGTETPEEPTDPSTRDQEQEL